MSIVMHKATCVKPSTQWDIYEWTRSARGNDRR